MSACTSPQQPSAEVMEPTVEATAMAEDLSELADGESADSEDSRYVVYSDGMLVQPTTQRRVLFFYASWCPTCKSSDQDLSSNMDRIPTDVTVIRLNYNDTQTDQAEKDLAKTYAVTYQHTFVEIDQDGKALQKWNGGGTGELLNRLK